MINYVFMYNLPDNSFMVKLPLSNSKYGVALTKAFEKLEFEEMAVEERKEINFGKDRRVYMVKSSPKIVTGIIATNEKPKRAVYALINEIYTQIKDTKSLSLEIQQWVEEEINAHNKGERMDATEKLKAKTDMATTKVKKTIVKAKEQKEQLTRIDQKVKDMKEDAKEFKENAKDVYLESWWYNNKLLIGMYGSVIIIGLCVGLYVFRMIL